MSNHCFKLETTEEILKIRTLPITNKPLICQSCDYGYQSEYK